MSQGFLNSLKHLVKKPLYAYQRRAYLRNPQGLNVPDFIGIGSGQAGSTWMFKNFQSHPGVFVCDKKETHYFNSAFDEWSFSYYCSLFDEGADLVSGELTPAYLLLTPQRIGEIRKLIPDVRLLMTIRNPIDRAWSGARRTFANLARRDGLRFEDYTEKDFFEYFDKEVAYRPERNLPGEYVPGMLQGHYSRAIDHWLQHFPEAQLKICFFDDIKNKPQALMSEVLEHIGASTDIDWSEMPLSKVVNKNPSHPIPDRYRSYLRELYNDELKELSVRFGDRITDWI